MDWLKYWKNSIKDADRKVIDVTTNPIEVNRYYIATVPSTHNAFLWSKEKKETKILNVVISPCSYVFNFEHGKKKKEEEQDLFPFWIPAQINREGQLQKKY